MARFYLIHGFNERGEGKDTVGRLREGLEKLGHSVKMIRYGWVHRVRVRLCNKCLAKSIASTVRAGSHVIAFSNGAALTYYSIKEGAPFDRVFLINPALNSRLAIPRVRQVDVFYSPSDPWTKLARFIPYSVWGRQGAVGYKGKDEEGRYTQVNLDELVGEKTKHGGVFRTEKGRRRIIQAIQNSLNKE
jgi:hypothetical protein